MRCLLSHKWSVGQVMILKECSESHYGGFEERRCQRCGQIQRRDVTVFVNYSTPNKVYKGAWDVVRPPGYEDCEYCGNTRTVVKAGKGGRWESIECPFCKRKAL